ncbi:hypothetical protein DEU56DRAFT_978226 [Suillus clintonianus]|uniref:uncharacterized protein n=1 Tax=Suillus clintonianus TaxID=1904413 RepID=UPI001B86B223|nr:uncharacterized protein DEU56DRAFT_978226 [Suillus clintonianus]KAG2147953.1 hypothetical protein DEU56DRAFT_978226 [Suillus clintonianus]
MQWIWSQAAYSIRYRASHAALPIRGLTSSIHFPSNIVHPYPPHPSLHRPFSLSCKYLSPPQAHSLPLPSHTYTQEATNPSSPPSPATASEISFAAARAVRMSCANGAIADALFIVNSLRRSNLPPQSSTDKGGGLLMPKLDYKPIDFGQPVSPALSAHCLLHHFVRQRMSLRARQLAEHLMQDGTPIRASTLHAVIQCQTERAKDGKLLQAQRPSQRDPWDIKPKQVEDQGTRLALKLLLYARQHRQRCYENTYQFIINICLVQGEIIVASLLFVLLVKDWEMKRAAAQVREQEWEASASILPRHGLGSLDGSPPSKRMLKMVLSKAQKEIMLDPAEKHNQPRREAALQALCIIAGLLDARLLPYTDVSSVLRTLYSVPKDPDKVWATELGKKVQVQPHKYIHRVILQLASDLSSSSEGACPQQSDVMPPLSLESYNALLHYALRHRQSIPLAKSLLHHLEHKRNPPLRPDITTYNVIIRSGSLLRQNDLTESALERIRRLKENDQHAIMVRPPPSLVVAADRLEANGAESKWAVALKHREAGLPAMGKPLKADSFTLTSYIQHLTATGKPDVVADILFHVIPELSIIDHPSWGSVTDEQRVLIRTQTRQMRLVRAVSLGPRFFIAVLNALRKAGKTGLAERVWLLAKQAERASLTGAIGIDGNVMKPWCLPIQAYTIMLQCYGAEAQRGLELRCAFKPRTNDWAPKIGGNKVRGWASFVLAQNAAARKHRSRRTLALLMGATLYRIMCHAGMAVWNGLSELQKVDQATLDPPRPDARFFNAALEMFGRQPRTFQRSSRTTPAHWRRKVTLGNVQFSKLGVRPRNWNPFLGRIVREMHALGFKIPSGFRRLFVGRWPYGFEEHRHRPELNKQPFAFPKLRRPPFRPHALRTLKTRGLPVRRTVWRVLGRRYRWRHRWRRKLQNGGKVL